MTSPPASPLRLQGASRTTGGFLRSRALGNVYNLADEMEIDGKLEGSQIRQAGKVHVYTSHCHPSDSKPYLSLKHPVTKSLAPVLEKLGIQYSPVKSKCIIISKYHSFDQNLELNQRVFVYEDDMWAVKGRYDAAVKEDDEIDWPSFNEQFTLKLLIVS
jgi:hypothetical protein